MAGPIEVVRDAAQAIEIGERLLRVAIAVERRNTLTETLSRGLSANGILFSGIVRTNAVGLGLHKSQVPFACLIVADPQSVGPIYVSNDDPSPLSAFVGAGIWEVPKGAGNTIIPLTGNDIWLYTPSNLAVAGINVCVLSIPPYRVVAL